MIELTVKPNSLKKHFYVADVIPVEENKTIAALMHLPPDEASKKKKISKKMERLGKKLDPDLPQDKRRKIRDDLIDLNSHYQCIVGPTVFYKLDGIIAKKLRVGLVLKKIPRNAVFLKS